MWVDRAAAYDDHSERQRLAQLQKKRREMDERHAKIGILSQNLAVRGIEKLLAKVQTDQQNLGPSELARLIKVGVKVGRLAMGESTDIQQAVGPGGGPVQIEHAFIRAVRRALGFNDPPDEV